MDKAAEEAEEERAKAEYEAQVRLQQAHKEAEMAREAALAERRRLEEEAAAIEAAKTPEQRQAEAEERQRLLKEKLEQERRAREEAERKHAEHLEEKRRRRQEIEDMRGEGMFYVRDHHGRSLVLDGMHANHFRGHNTFKLYHLGELMGIASAGRIYDIPAHGGITEVRGIELHDTENMLNKVSLNLAKPKGLVHVLAVSFVQKGQRHLKGPRVGYFQDRPHAEEPNLALKLDRQLHKVLYIA